jgi:malonyl-CoA decarboxylase
VAPNLPAPDRQRLVKAIEGLLAKRESTAQRAAAETLVEAYVGLDADGHRRFLEALATDFGPDAAAIDAAIARVRAATPGSSRIAAERALRQAVIPRYAAVLHVVTGLPHGVQFLMELRADLLALRSDDPGLGFLDDELTGHLSSLFDVGLLELRQITWDSPASVLERLIATEAVHQIKGWDDLRHRLAGNQRCYGFFHPTMPNEPIVFVEIALTHGLADKLADLLERQVAAHIDADTAIFYSITSCQPGLAGVHLGNELIKHVVDGLYRDLAELRTFATLSPMPGFRRWLRARVDAGELTPAERESLGRDVSGVVTLEDTAWLDDQAFANRIRPGLLSLAARYLTTAERGRAPDAVANFHLSNGASVERVNWLANREPYGIEESLGLMVNYLYDRSRISENADAYLSAGTIRASNQVRNLVKTAKL